MRLLALATVTSLICGAAAAQPAAPSVPRAFGDYAQPDITPGLCKNVSPTQSQCTIPAMTAGRYLIEAAGTATSNAADAFQRITIQVGSTSCQVATNKAPWPANTPRTFRFDCVVTVLTDQPLTVTAAYDDFHATKDPKGPTISVRRLPWEGVLTAAGFAPPQQRAQQPAQQPPAARPRSR